MSEWKQIDPLALASITDGRVLCDFSLVHQAIQHLLGHPVWTHELAGKALRERVQELVRRQFPDMPGPSDTAWETVRDAVRAKYGRAVSVKGGTDVRTEDPIQSAQRLFNAPEN